MDGLKALLAKKRKAAQEEFGGKSSAKRVEIEQTRLDQLRNEERVEIAAKVRQVAQQTGTHKLQTVQQKWPNDCRKLNVWSSEPHQAVGTCSAWTQKIG